MADNLEDFFNVNTSIHLSKATWMLILLIPMLSICSIRRLSVLAPFAMAANFVYVLAVAVVLFFFLSDLRPISSIPWFGKTHGSSFYFFRNRHVCFRRRRCDHANRKSNAIAALFYRMEWSPELELLGGSGHFLGHRLLWISLLGR
ncbi:unnamed protein product [Caenorhabditis auriculariae]|uniref:Amino acid transporter transmembrane domain-containing protein n=1 Tax=Caenorhabditis auriculariae TaxID=2777116 RepID=A0A8S1GRH5_9PELO|nr:unnamed protein product [Caenorhabditis auriculariae]